MSSPIINLYIKRAQANHNKQFIAQAFEDNEIGKVKDIRIIKKNTDFGEYNAIIVIFECLYMNSNVTKLLEEMEKSEDGSTKFTFDEKKGKYWHINIYKRPIPEYEENEEIAELKTKKKLTDKERIAELERIVHSMMVNAYYVSLKEQKYKLRIEELEHDNTRAQLVNLELENRMEEIETMNRYLEEEVDEMKKMEETEMDKALSNYTKSKKYLDSVEFDTALTNIKVSKEDLDGLVVLPDY